MNDSRNKTIYTIGYGNDPPNAFLDRLDKAGIELVIDVRRRGSRARLGCYAPSERFERGMPTLLTTRAIDYRWVMELGNPFKSKEDDMVLYEAWLVVKLREKKMGNIFFCIIREISLYHGRTAFLCAEKSAMKNGHRNCHRVIIAEKVAKRLGIEDGYEWSVVHL